MRSPSVNESRTEVVSIFSRMCLMLLFAALLVLGPTAARCTTWHVPLERSTIRAAIDSASYGDTVLVAPGTYYTTYDRATWVWLAPGISLLSENGAENTIIEFCGNDAGVILGEATRISGFTIRFVAGSGPDCEHPPDPVTGVLSPGCTDAVAENCVIEDCDYGIKAEGRSSQWWKPLFKNNIIRNCGYGIYCEDMYDAGRPYFDHNVITDCGEGASIWDSSPIFDFNQVTHCRFYGFHFYGNCTGDCSGNAIAFNPTGVYIWADPALGAPTFNGSWDPQLANDFHDNTNFDIDYEHPHSFYFGMTAIYNYWGSKCPDFDHKLNGEINYSPWMDSTHTKVLTQTDCPDATEPTTWGAIKAMYK
jgi:hypothetical protein